MRPGGAQGPQKATPTPDLGTLFGDPRHLGIMRALFNAEIETTEELLKRSHKKLCFTQWVGENRADKIRDVLATHGLALAPDAPAQTSAPSVNPADASAWELIIKTVKRGKDAPKPTLEERHKRALLAVGGWSGLRGTQESSLPFKQKDFLQACKEV